MLALAIQMRTSASYLNLTFSTELEKKPHEFLTNQMFHPNAILTIMYGGKKFQLPCRNEKKGVPIRREHHTSWHVAVILFLFGM